LCRRDFHVHTRYSDCGQPEATPKAVVQAAREAGLEALGIADHVIFPHDRSRPAMVRQQLPVEADGLRLYVGCEADMQSPTRCTIDPEFAAGLDFVVVSASHLYLPGVELPPNLDPPATAAFILELTEAAIGTGLADIIAHPFVVPAGPWGFEQLVGAAAPAAIDRMAHAAAHAGVAMEFNPRQLKITPESARWFYGRLLEAGVKLAVNSDAHHPRDVGCRSEAYAREEEMREAGVTEDCLWRIEDRAGPNRQ
jgi:histidinol phosphatase-like PHP family hydrolase